MQQQTCEDALAAGVPQRLIELALEESELWEMIEATKESSPTPDTTKGDKMSPNPNPTQIPNKVTK